jgi:hypothetical protein
MEPTLIWNHQLDEIDLDASSAREDGERMFDEMESFGLIELLDLTTSIKTETIGFNGTNQMNRFESTQLDWIGCQQKDRFDETDRGNLDILDRMKSTV